MDSDSDLQEDSLLVRDANVSPAKTEDCDGVGGRVVSVLVMTLAQEEELPESVLLLIVLEKSNVH